MDATENATTFDRLEFRARVAVVWGFFWRAVVITLASTLGGAIAGFVLGFLVSIIARVLGYDTSSYGLLRTVQIVSGTAGALIGVFFFWQYIRWLFRARLSGFRLALVREKSDAV